MEPMSTHAASTLARVTVTLAPHASGRLGVRIDDELVGTIKDGGRIIRNADALLREAHVYRSAGYVLNEDNELVASALRLA